MMKALFYFIKFKFIFIFLTRVSYLGINFFGGSGFLVGTCWFVLLPSPIICILIFWIHVTDQRPSHYDFGSHHLLSAGFVLDFLFYHPFFHVETQKDASLLQFLHLAWKHRYPVSGSSLLQCLPSHLPQACSQGPGKHPSHLWTWTISKLLVEVGSLLTLSQVQIR